MKKVRPSYRYAIDGRALVVIDGVFDDEAVAATHRALASLPYFRKEADRMDVRHVLTFATDISIAKIAGTEPFDTIIGLLAVAMPRETLELTRSYCNLGVHGDLHFPHRDCAAGGTDVTALYYANPVWDASWAGETVFFNERGDSVAAINPRPGRVVIFHGSIEHRAGMVSRACDASRLTLALKFRSAKPRRRRRPVEAK